MPGPNELPEAAAPFGTYGEMGDAGADDGDGDDQSASNGTAEGHADVVPDAGAGWPGKA